MKKNSKLGLIFSLFVFFFVFNVFSTKADEGVAPIKPVVEENELGKDCFDYYKFQSVGVMVGVERGPYSPGETLKFSGDIKNENNYPVVDGYLFVRIGKENPNYMTEGQDLVDEFFALEKINLDSQEKKAVDFVWKVPQNLPNGKYAVNFFFSVGKKFNLAGLPFSNEVIAGVTYFEVNNSTEAVFKANRSETKINGQKYNHVGNWPNFKTNEKAVVEQPIDNFSNQNQKVEVQYDLYYWDSLNNEDRLDSKKESLDITAKGSAVASYVIPEMKETVYSLKISSSIGAQKSIVNLRLTSEQERSRINYPAISAFPINKGEKVNLFSCFHNTSGKSTEGKLVVRLTDNEDKQVGKLEYSGKITSSMQADAIELTANRDLDYLKLSAEMYDRNNNIIDRYETVYDCQYFNKCKPKSSVINVTKGSVFKNIFVVFGLLTIILVALVLVIKKTKRKSGGNNVSGLLLLAFLGAALFFGSNSVSASEDKSVLGTQHYRHWYVESGRRIATGDITATHVVTRNSDSNIISLGGNVSFAWDSVKSSVFFTSNGGDWDTPYAYNGPTGGNNWLGIDKDTDQPKWLDYMKTGHDSYVQKIDNNGDIDEGRITFSVEAPSGITMSSSDTSIVSCSGMTCTASGTNSGTVTLTTTIPSSQARIYSVVRREAPCGQSEGGQFLEASGNCYIDSQGYNVRLFWIGEAWKRGTYDNGQSYLSTTNDWADADRTSLLDLPSKTIEWAVTVVAPPSMTLTANPTVVKRGDSTTLNWSNSGGVPSGNCTSNFGQTSSSGSSSVTPSGTTTYSITCSNVAGSSPASVTVQVVDPPVVTQDCQNKELDISWGAINGNSTYYVDVSTDNFTTWSAKSIINGVTSTSFGSADSFTPVFGTTYAVRISYVTPAVHSGISSVLFDCPLPPIMTLTPNKTMVIDNEPVTLTWSKAGGPLNTPPPPPCSSTNLNNATTESGTYTTTINTTTDFSVTCNGPGGTGSDSDKVFFCGSPDCVIGGFCVKAEPLTYTCSGNVAPSCNGETCVTKQSNPVCTGISPTSCPTIDIKPISNCPANANGPCEVETTTCPCKNSNWYETAP